MSKEGRKIGPYFGLDRLYMLVWLALDDNSIAALAASPELDTGLEHAGQAGAKMPVEYILQGKFVTYNLICIFTTIRQTPCLLVH